MVGKILRTAGMLTLWFCLATLLAQIALVAFLVWQWKIDSQRLVDIIRVARGEKLSPPPPTPTVEELLLKEDPAYEDYLSRRAQKARDLELKEMQLRAAEELVQSEWTKLAAEKGKLAQSQKELEQKLAQAEDAAKSAARETVRGILESLRPDQAKAQLQAMTSRGDWDEAVAILTAMPASKRSRILGEFKSPEDRAVLGELLRRIGNAGLAGSQAVPAAAGSTPAGI